jgi:phage/plasmid primase-like uncharacterized protein
MNTDPVSDFRGSMASYGMVYSGPILGDGALHRFSCDGDKSPASWYTLHLDAHPAGRFGCHRRGISQPWRAESNGNMDPKTRAEMTAQFAKEDAERKLKQEATHAATREKVSKLFASCLPATEDHPYLQRKCVPLLGDVRLSPNNELLIPMSDATGVLHSIQRIDTDGDKLFEPGGRVKGCLFKLSDRPDGPLILAEGYATGATCHQATGWSVWIAFSQQNLHYVSKDARKLFPSRTLILAADNDERLLSENDPCPRRGIHHATEAAKAVKGHVAIPEGFSDQDTTGTDFNDLAVTSGLESVRKILRCSFSDSEDWMAWVEDASDTLKESIPDPVEIVQGLVTEQSKVVIGAASKTYKTFLSMDMAISISHGLPCVGFPCQRRKVLYINLELKPSTFKKRIQTLCHAKGVSLDSNWLQHISLRGKLAGTNVSTIVSKIIALCKASDRSVCFLDPVYKVNLEGDENSSHDQTLLFNQLDRITTEAQSALILNDHFSKGNQSEKDPLDAIRGSSAKGGDLDCAIIIRPHKEKGSFTVDVVHRELPPIEPFVISWNFPLYERNQDLDPQDLKPLKRGRAVEFDFPKTLSAISNRTESHPVSLSEWATLANVKRTTLIYHRLEMHSKGWITTVGQGGNAKIAITQKGVSYCAGVEP